MGNLCCGMIWESKGMPDIADEKVKQLETALAEASEGGRWPVVCDQSPCLHRMRDHISSMKLYEPAEFIHDFMTPYLCFHKHDIAIAVHVTCSSRRMGISDKIVALAKMCSNNVLVPEGIGLLRLCRRQRLHTPGTKPMGPSKLKPQIEAAGIVAGYSNSRTCEIGLTTNSGIPYKSIVYLVDESTTPK